MEHTLWPFELMLWGPLWLAYIAVVRYRYERWPEQHGPAAGVRASDATGRELAE
jgi:hypothetical protein